MNAQAPAPPLYETISPTLKWLLTVCIMMATIMQALDTTIANVALPYMQGSLATTQDQINWVLTSYIVAAAIMTSPLGWMATRFGRKKLFIVCTAGFTVASMLCGVALSIEQMVAYRLLQGVFGAALVPLSQAVMLDIFPPAKRGSAMAIWGMGVMLGPIMGPTLGGWLTDSYSWRWVFFVNLPFGILTTAGLWVFMSETPTRRDVPFSWFGFLSLSLGIGSLQMMLDRGEQLGWFESPEIIVEAILSVVGFYFFFADCLTSARPFISVRIFKDWNFSIALVFMFLVGIMLLASMALVTPFIQNLLGYPVLSSGFLLGTRGIGTFVGMFLVGRLSGRVDPRVMIFIGLVLAAGSLWLMVGWNLDVPANTIVINSIAQGLGLGFIFVPLNTIAFASLPGELRTEGAALWTLIRNIGSSVGISVVIARLTSMTTMFHSQLVEHATPFNDALRMPNASMVWGHGLPSMAMLEGIITQQAAMMAYSNDFLFMTFIALCAFPLLALIRSTKSAAPVSREGRRARGHGLTTADHATLGEPLRRLRIVGGQIDRRPRFGERPDGGKRRRRLVLVVADAVDRPLEHRLLVVRRVAGDKNGRVAVFDDHRQVVARVAGRSDSDDRAVGGQTFRLRKRPVSAVIENERLRIERLRPALRQIAAKPPSGAFSALKLARADEDFARREGAETGIVVDVQVGQHDLLDVCCGDAERPQLRACLLL